MCSTNPKIISRRWIKPSIPTPRHLKTFNLSLLDQLSPAIHSNMTFFFPSGTKNNASDDILNKSQLLQSSLSKTLTLFYPFAGHVSGITTIDCNDEGAFFVEAKVDTDLSTVLHRAELELIDPLLPANDVDTMEIANGSLLIIQFISFSCGGVAMSVSLSHKIADAATLISFLRIWAAIARDSNPDIPIWTASTLLPPRHDLPGLSASVNMSANKFVARRFAFSATKIAELRAKAMENGMQHLPSRVEVVLAMLWRCAVTANIAKSGIFKPSAMFQAVNLRKRMIPPLPDATIGNFMWPFWVLLQEEKDLEIHELVIKIQKAFNDFCKEKAAKFNGKEGCLTVLGGLKERGEFFKNNKDLNLYKCTSLCKFPFYDVDYGWGKPVWHVSINNLVSNTICLTDTKSGNGIEAMVTLDDEEMAIFECNKELLEFASVNPSVKIINSRL